MVCCLVAVFSGCEEDDDYRGYMLSGRWFGNLGMMVDGQPAIGSDLEFIPQDYGGYTQGYGYETDYYYGWRGRVEIVEHYFTWTVRDGIIYLRFDNPELDCNIRDYSLSPDYFEGYMDGVYSSTCKHSIFRHDNFIGCFSADKIKMSARKYFCFNIPIDKNMAEGLFCRSPYHEEYIQTSASGNPEGLYH